MIKIDRKLRFSIKKTIFARSVPIRTARPLTAAYPRPDRGLITGRRQEIDFCQIVSDPNRPPARRRPIAA